MRSQEISALVPDKLYLVGRSNLPLPMMTMMSANNPLQLVQQSCKQTDTSCILLFASLTMLLPCCSHRVTDGPIKQSAGKGCRHIQGKVNLCCMPDRVPGCWPAVDFLCQQQDQQEQWLLTEQAAALAPQEWPAETCLLGCY